MKLHQIMHSIYDRYIEFVSIPAAKAAGIDTLLCIYSKARSTQKCSDSKFTV